MLCAGQTYRASITVGDNSVPASTVTLTITKPDQTIVTVSNPVNSPPGSGTYYYDYVLPMVGLYQISWATTGPSTAPLPDYINVRNYISIVSIAEAREHLKKTTDASDEELGKFMMAATELVESKVGICVPRQLTDRVDEGRLRIVVPGHPIMSVSSVTSIWPGGPAWDSTVLHFDAEAGIIYQVPPFDFWWSPWDVTYTVGRQVIPERFIHAAKEQLRHLWETQRGGQPPALLQGEEEFTTETGFSFTVPRRVLELLEADIIPAV